MDYKSRCRWSARIPSAERIPAISGLSNPKANAESYYQIRLTLGHHASSVHICSSSQVQSAQGLATESGLDARLTELNARAKYLLTVKYKCSRQIASCAIDQERVASFIHYVLHSDRTWGCMIQECVCLTEQSIIFSRDNVLC